MSESLLDVPTIAARWGVCERWVYDRLKSRELRGAKIGARWLVPESEVDRFVRNRVERPEDRDHAAA